MEERERNPHPPEIANLLGENRRFLRTCPHNRKIACVVFYEMKK